MRNLPVPQGDVLHVVPRPSVSVFHPPPVSIDLPEKPNVDRRVFRRERSSGLSDRPVPTKEFQIQLRLFHVTREIAGKLELPSNRDRTGVPATVKPAGEKFNALLEPYIAGDALRILADPTLVTTLGREASLQNQIYADGRQCRLSIAVSPEQWENGLLKMSMDAEITLETAPTNSGSNRDIARHQVQADVEITPESMGVCGPWPLGNGDRLIYLLVQAQPILRLQSSEQTQWFPVPPRRTANPVPSSSSGSRPPESVPATTPSALAPILEPPVQTTNAMPPSSRPHPLLAEPWPQKLPSDYARQRQEILADVSEAAEMAARSVNDELMRTRGRLRAVQAQEQLRVLAEEYDGNMMLHQVRCEQQASALRIVEEQYEQVSQQHNAGQVSGAELAKAKAALQQAKASHWRAQHLLGLYRSNRDAIVNQEEPLEILREFQRVADMQLEKTEKQQQESEAREEAKP